MTRKQIYPKLFSQPILILLAFLMLVIGCSPAASDEENLIVVPDTEPDMSNLANPDQEPSEPDALEPISSEPDEAMSEELQPTAELPSTPVLAPTIVVGQSAGTSVGPPGSIDVSVTKIEGYDLVVSERAPYSAEITIHGVFPSACHYFEGYDRRDKGDVITITIEDRTYPERRCEQENTPFIHTFKLDLAQLAAGDYLLEVNGYQQVLTVPDPRLQDDVAFAEAKIINASLQTLRSWPLEVNLVVEGELPDDCTTVSYTEQTVTDDEIDVRVYTQTETNRGCADIALPFSEIIPLKILGLRAGEYRVTVNGMSEDRSGNALVVKLDQDNE